jgi:hypothetical protein
VVQLTRSGSTWSTELRNISADQAGLYFLTARHPAPT